MAQVAKKNLVTLLAYDLIFLETGEALHSSTVKTPIPRFSKSWLNCPCKILVSDGRAFPDMALKPLVP
jgi:hypothetical protein